MDPLTHSTLTLHPAHLFCATSVVIKIVIRNSNLAISFDSMRTYKCQPEGQAASQAINMGSCMCRCCIWKILTCTSAITCGRHTQGSASTCNDTGLARLRQTPVTDNKAPLTSGDGHIQQHRCSSKPVSLYRTCIPFNKIPKLCSRDGHTGTASTGS